MKLAFVSTLGPFCRKLSEATALALGTILFRLLRVPPGVRLVAVQALDLGVALGQRLCRRRGLQLGQLLGHALQLSVNEPNGACPVGSRRCLTTTL
ncbi:MAG TPA: hypothetical protein VD761_07740 [Solirubrobacterales bacterium]|nr:hypothetical protein [Solirubrobacterales bacterium]